MKYDFLGKRGVFASKKSVKKGIEITARHDVTFVGVSGQVALGKNISQTQTLSREDQKNLYNNLLQFQKEIAKINLSAKESIKINRNLSAAIKETEKEQPNTLNVLRRFLCALATIKEVGNTIECVSKWEWTKKILKILGKLGLSVIL
jgi:hypothetical protein